MSWSVLLLVGCFAPDFADGQIPCGPKGECPASLSCAADEKCWHAGRGPDPCLAGYTRVHGVCTDVDECQTGAAACDAHATCTNTPGAYTCACVSGWSGDGKTCTDVDECRAGTAVCDAHASCTNTPGTYTCACKPGWTGDGKTCAPSFGPVAIGMDHACAIRGDGALFCWGANDVGQLGTGLDQPGVRVPTRVGAALWKSVAAAGAYTCGIETDGSLWCWGDDACGTIGDGATGNCRATQPVGQPYPTGGAGTTWLAVATGLTHACAIQGDGSLWCWGRNVAGDLGTSDAQDHLVATRVGTDVGWGSVRAGAAHTCGLRSGQLWCWGENASGQLGDGGAEPDIPFPKRIGTGSAWVALAAGDQHTCGVLSDQTLACWGSGLHGQLGDGMSGPDVLAKAPTVVPGGALWAAVAAGEQETCARTTTGGLYCFGQNLFGQLGDGSFVDRAAPAAVAGSDWAVPSVGAASACATKTSGQMWCWGRNASGVLGLGTGGDATTPVAVRGVKDWGRLSFGAAHGCGLRADHTLWCWGDNSTGQLGLGATGGARDAPTPVSGGGSFTQVGAGGASTCAVQTGGALFCWGDNSYGQLGIGTSGFDAGMNLPTRVPDPPGAPPAVWSQVAVNALHACGIQADGSLWCWGHSDSGELGIGPSSGDGATPTPVAGSGWTAVATGLGHTCGIHGGALLCWGQNFDGQCGTGQQPPNNPQLDTPTPVGQDQDWIAVSAGASHSCGLRGPTRALSCWGYNYYGQVGNGSSGANANAYAPSQVFGLSWLTVEAGAYTTCGVAMDGNPYCWGDNFGGLVGNGNAGDVVVTPVAIDDAKDYVAVELMGLAGCGLHADGSTACWGQDQDGEFGDDTSFYEAPARVVDPK